MFHYAILNEENVCIGLSTLTGAVNDPKMVPIPEAAEDHLFRKYENGEWSAEKFLPEAPDVRLSEFEELQQIVADLAELLFEKGGS